MTAVPQRLLDRSVVTEGRTALAGGASSGPWAAADASVSMTNPVPVTQDRPAAQPRRCR